MTENNYEGIWILIPELSFYQEGSPPEEGRYKIGISGGNVEFSVSWVINSEHQSVDFSGPLDGKLHPSDMARDSEISFTRVDEYTLESEFIVAGVRMAFARRQVSRDGTLMTVLQESRKPDGSLVLTTQVYRRDA